MESQVRESHIALALADALKDMTSASFMTRDVADTVFRMGLQVTW